MMPAATRAYERERHRSMKEPARNGERLFVYGPVSGAIFVQMPGEAEPQHLRLFEPEEEANGYIGLRRAGG